LDTGRDAAWLLSAQLVGGYVPFPAATRRRKAGGRPHGRAVAEFVRSSEAGVAGRVLGEVGPVGRAREEGEQATIDARPCVGEHSGILHTAVPNACVGDDHAAVVARACITHACVGDDDSPVVARAAIARAYGGDDDAVARAGIARACIGDDHAALGSGAPTRAASRR